jgi:hypothetical protein
MMTFWEYLAVLLLVVVSITTGAFAAKWGTLSRQEPLEIEMIDTDGNIVLSHGVPSGWPGVLAAKIQTGNPPPPPAGMFLIYPKADGWYGRGPTGSPFKLGGPTGLTLSEP